MKCSWTTVNTTISNTLPGLSYCSILPAELFEGE